MRKKKKKKRRERLKRGKNKDTQKETSKRRKKKTHTHTRIYRERGERELRTTKLKKSICGKRTAKILRRDFFSEANRNTRHTLFIRIEEKKKKENSHTSSHFLHIPVAREREAKKAIEDKKKKKSVL